MWPPVGLRHVGEGDVVVPDAPEAGEDLGEGRDDEVLAVPGVEVRGRSGGTPGYTTLGPGQGAGSQHRPTTASQARSARPARPGQS